MTGYVASRFLSKRLFAESTPCASAGGTPTCHIEVKAPTYIRSGCTDLRASSSHRPWAEGSSLYVGIQENILMCSIWSLICRTVWCLFWGMFAIPLNSHTCLFRIHHSKVSERLWLSCFLRLRNSHSCSSWAIKKCSECCIFCCLFLSYSTTEET